MFDSYLETVEEYAKKASDTKLPVIVDKFLLEFNNQFLYLIKINYINKNNKAILIKYKTFNEENVEKSVPVLVPIIQQKAGTLGLFLKNMQKKWNTFKKVVCFLASAIVWFFGANRFA